MNELVYGSALLSVTEIFVILNLAVTKCQTFLNSTHERIYRHISWSEELDQLVTRTT